MSTPVPEPYLLRLDETGTPSYVGRGDSLSRPSTLSCESIGVGTSISSILNSYPEPCRIPSSYPRRACPVLDTGGGDLCTTVIPAEAGIQGWGGANARECQRRSPSHAASHRHTREEPAPEKSGAAIQGWGGASVSPRLNGTGSKMPLRSLPSWSTIPALQQFRSWEAPSWR